MTEGYQYCAVPAAGSKHFQYRVYRTQPDHNLPGSFLQLRVKPGTSKQAVIEHLDRIRDWILLGDEVQTVRPDTFFLEVEPITRLDVYQRGRRGKPKRYRARFPKGQRELI